MVYGVYPHWKNKITGESLPKTIFFQMEVFTIDEIKNNNVKFYPTKNTLDYTKNSLENFFEGSLRLHYFGLDNVNNTVDKLLQDFREAFTMIDNQYISIEQCLLFNYPVAVLQKLGKRMEHEKKFGTMDLFEENNDEFTYRLKLAMKQAVDAFRKASENLKVFIEMM
ncbi:unnamed protein product [Caenorhabditis bovis]|uniref:Uncharacterized protein n=1 Tax=Caenorhabditis bovis TaxID=2654633 RepID=A0A8S1EHZ1_9PELO|nr:unnamed protein product [Caenorhabditis bovis]